MWNLPVIKSRRVHDLVYGWILAEADPDLRINIDYKKLANRLGIQSNTSLYRYINGLVAERWMSRQKDRLMPVVGREISREGLVTVLLTAGEQRHCLGIFSVLYNKGPMKDTKIRRELGFTVGGKHYMDALERLEKGGLIEEDERGYWYLTNAYL